MSGATRALKVITHLPKPFDSPEPLKGTLNKASFLTEIPVPTLGQLDLAQIGRR